MAKHFISILGASEYSNATYCCEEGKFTTKFIQEAILKLKFKEWMDNDKITIFMTEKSREENWLDRPYREREKQMAETKGVDLPEYRGGLQSVLKESFASHLNESEYTIIPLGANEEELWRIFQNIINSLREKDELYIDITHAMRNIPVQMLAVAVYARVVKDVQVKAIYYGAFEAGNKGAEGLTEAPIFDLITFLDVIDWSQAAYSFVRYGNSEQIEELFRVQKERSSVKMRDLFKVVTEIGNITSGLETSRGYYDFKDASKNKGGKSILESYHQYRESYQIMMKKDSKEQNEDRRQLGSVKPLKGLMELVNEKLSIFDVSNNLDLGLAAIRWSIDNNKTQQGFTALEETLKTFLCNYYGLDETRELYRDGVCKRACNVLSRELQENGAIFLTPQMRENAYQKWLKETEIPEEVDVEKVEKIYLSVPKDLVVLAMDISNNRNSMNHFGYSNIGQFNSKKLNENLREYHQRFLECIGQM